ncbi:hypothetical protein [uncultured Deinococcus sp.]|uniref:hypothetical protein n=1 Tax=uncultured Deinococcus sp. TaxID=158789 RepID=UPI0025F16F77|nr:hypothetical protein [uncultured Deinococcus sp.]
MNTNDMLILGNRLVSDDTLPDGTLLWAFVEGEPGSLAFVVRVEGDPQRAGHVRVTQDALLLEGSSAAIDARDRVLDLGQRGLLPECKSGHYPPLVGTRTATEWCIPLSVAQANGH